MNPLQADPRKRKIASLGYAQVYCAIAIVLFLVLSVMVHDHTSALFFRVAAGLDFTVAIVLEVRKQGLKKAIAAEEAEYRRLNPGSTPGVWPPPQ